MLTGESNKLRYLFLIAVLPIFIINLACNSRFLKKSFNGGFEIKKVNANEPQGWFATRVPQTSNFVKFVWDSTVKHSGSYSVSISIDSTHPNEIIDYNWANSFPDFEINKKYSISGWVKTINVKTTAFLVVQCWTGSYNKMISFFTNQGRQPVTGTTDWKFVQYDFKVPEGTKIVLVRAGLAAPDNNGGKVWFDDINIE
jgi:hypothetical protein